MFMRTTAEAWDLPGSGASTLHVPPPPAEPADALVGTDTRRLEAAIAQTTALLTGRLAEVEQPFSGTTPAALSKAFEGLDLDRPLPSLGTALQEVSRLYLRDAIYFHHPRYMAHLNCPIAWPAVAAELIAATVNSSVDTWDQSAGGTHIEQALIDWTAGRIGLPAATADGVFTSGGPRRRGARPSGDRLWRGASMRPGPRSPLRDGRTSPLRDGRLSPLRAGRSMLDTGSPRSGSG